MSKILEKLGLTPEQIRTHVTDVKPPLAKWQNKTRAKYLSQGLTSRGKPRKTKPRKQEVGNQ